MVDQVGRARCYGFFGYADGQTARLSIDKRTSRQPGRRAGEAGFFPGQQPCGEGFDMGRIGQMVARRGRVQRDPQHQVAGGGDGGGGS